MQTKRALVVGIEKYANPRNNLIGVSNDISAFMRILAKYGVSDVEVIRDANATSINIRNALDALVRDAGDGDVRIFYFTGHGTLLPESYRFTDDPDGRDEALVPYEGTTESLILDNWFGKFLKEKLPLQSSFYSIIDSCHSGQMYKGEVVLDLANNRIDANVDMPTAKEIDFASLVFGANPMFVGGASSGNYSIKEFIIDEELVNSIHFGASEPEQTALVLPIDGERRSVFTWALEQVLTPGMTIGELEPLLVAKQAEKTKHHKPFIACRETNKSLAVFS